MKRLLVAFVGVMVAAALLLLLLDLSAVDRSYVEDSAKAAHESSDSAYYEISQHCLRLPAPEAQECAYQARNTENQQQYGERNLAAQRQTAWWTKWMGIAALIGMAVGILGAWLIYITYRAAREANERGLRPYVLFLDSQVRGTERHNAGLGYWQLAFDVTNNGQTPARIISAVVGREIVPHGTEPDFTAVSLMSAPEGAPVIPKDGNATFTTTIGLPTLESAYTEVAGLRVVQVLARCKIKYRGVTDAETVEYQLDRIRLVSFVKYPADGYGAGKTTFGDDPRVRVDHVT